jgi:hypothetical protein
MAPAAADQAPASDTTPAPAEDVEPTTAPADTATDTTPAA